MSWSDILISYWLAGAQTGMSSKPEENSTAIPTAVNGVEHGEEEDALFRSFPIVACEKDIPPGDKSSKPNAIRTTKFTALTWLPKSIFVQFRRVANIYFLGISVLMTIGTVVPELFISPLDPVHTIVTLMLILMVTSCKEGYEDLQRRRSDKFENNREGMLT